MKLRFLSFLIFALCCSVKSYSQYKDLEGVFFGKVIAVGAGGSIQLYSEKLIGTVSSVTPITYSVLLNPKKFTSMRFAIHQEFNAEFEGNDGFTNFKRTAKCKFLEFEFAYKFAITGEGLDKPISLFVNLQAGTLFGKKEIIDSRYSSSIDDRGSSFYMGAGLSLFRRVGSRVIVFAEPTYRVDLTPKPNRIYLGNNGDKPLSLTNISSHVGVMFLIGKSN